MSSESKISLSRVREYSATHPEIKLSRLAKITGLPKSSLYYKSTQPAKDIITKELILQTLEQDPFLGSKRMSDHLKVFSNITLNHKKISRVKQLFGIQVRYHRANPFKRDRGLADVKTLGITNLVKELTPEYPNHIWSSDFTYLLFKGSWYYVATLKDNFTKEIVGWNFDKYHNESLITQAFQKAVSVFGKPIYLHSDQGSEYRAVNYLYMCRSIGIQISMSAKGCPYENGYQESYYNYFKLELGNVNRFHNIQELEFAVGRQIWHYNNFRIHSVIRTAPALFRKQYQNRVELQKQAKIETESVYESQLTIPAGMATILQTKIPDLSKNKSLILTQI